MDVNSSSPGKPFDDNLKMSQATKLALGDHALDVRVDEHVNPDWSAHEERKVLFK